MNTLHNFLAIQPVGCDHKLDSGVKYDRCAVCGGDSSTCTYVSSNYTKNWFEWGKNWQKIIYLVTEKIYGLFYLLSTMRRGEEVTKEPYHVEKGGREGSILSLKVNGIYDVS